MSTATTNIPPPGEFIREELEARGWSQRDLAYVLGSAEQAVGLILSGKRSISAEMAKALGDAFDVPAEFFANLQRAHDLSRAKSPDPGVARKARLQSTYPVREMVRRGWIADGNAERLESALAAFFEAESIDNVPHLPHAAKRPELEGIPPAQLAWLFRVRQIAREMVVPTFSSARLRERLDEMRDLLSTPEDARHVPRLLAECGVRFVLVECLPGSKIDGVCVWVDGQPVIGLSCRYDRIDNFWFVVRHEIEHVLQKHGQTTPIVDSDLEGERAGTGPDIPEEERIANAAASDFCVPAKKMDDFFNRKNPYFSERDVLGFAALMRVHPGLVAGQLRRRTGNWKAFSKHLAKVRSAVASAATVDGWGEMAPLSN
jgi:HTH-type transcriptional regulator/antitoxin HigA